MNRATAFASFIILCFSMATLSGCPQSASSEGGCTTSADCDMGVCDRYTGECLLPEEMPEGPGDPCGGPLACPENTECVSQGNQSVCMELCDTPGEPCDSGVMCVATSEGPSICYLGSDTEPRDGCTSDAQCLEGQRCLRDATSGTCVDPCQTAGELCDGGELCSTTSEGNLCLPGGSVPRGGTCESVLDCSKGNLCVGAGEQNYCVAACNNASDCRPGQRCQELEVNPGSVCRPGIGASCAVDEDCDGGQVCTAAFSDVIGWVNLYPNGYCTVRSCSPGMCPDGSVCRTPGDRDPICAQTCEVDTDCRFQQSWECLDESACEAGAAGDACRAYFGQEKLCMRRDRLNNLSQ